MKLELVSFKICPFVQRAVITLLEKNIAYDIKYIDLKDPPEWFLKLSPLGKVPILKVDDTVLYESAVIVEYLDEVCPPSLHPADPLLKAQNRAWIEFGSNLIFDQHGMLTAKNKTEYDEKTQKLRDDLNRLEQQLSGGPYFNGEQFSLVDAAYAPPLMRFSLIDKFYDFKLLNGHEKLLRWQSSLLHKDSVKNSVVPEFEELYVNFIRSANGYVAQLFS